MLALISKLVALKPLNFIKKALSEQDGTPSMSRYTAFLVTVSVIGWVTFVVIHTGVLPDLTSSALFLAGGHSGYVANKVSDFAGGGSVPPIPGSN